MGKRVKLSLDLVISDEKKEVAVNETDNTEIMPKSTGAVIIPGSAKRTRRKKLFTTGLVMVGMLLLGLGTYGIIRQGTADKVIDEPPKYEVQEPQVQEPQVNEPQVQMPTEDKDTAVNVIDVTNIGIRDIVTPELSDLVDGESSPIEGLSEKINQFPTYAETRSFIEMGYYYEMYKVIEDGIFTLEFVAATGLENNPMLLLNVYVDDEKLVAENDKIEVFAHCLDQETYDTYLSNPRQWMSNHRQWNAYGVQDKYNPHLYHVTLPSGSYLAAGNWVVFDMTTIRIGAQNVDWMEYKVNLKAKIKAPYQVAFYPSIGIDSDGLEFKSDTKTYKLYWTQIAYDQTDLVFFYDFDDVYYDEKIVGNDGTQFGKFIKEVVLEINGVEYKVNPDAVPYINMSDDKENLHYYVYAEFPGIKDVVGIKDVIVKYRDIEYRLR